MGLGQIREVTSPPRRATSSPCVVRVTTSALGGPLSVTKRDSVRLFKASANSENDISLELISSVTGMALFSARASAPSRDSGVALAGGAAEADLLRFIASRCGKLWVTQWKR